MTVFEVSLVFEDTIYDELVRIKCCDQLGVDSVGVKVEGNYSRNMGSELILCD